MVLHITHPEGERAARILLRRLGCPQSAGIQLMPRYLPVTALVATGLVAALVVGFAPTLVSRQLKVELGPVLVAAGLFFGILQWRLTCEQQALAAFEKDIA